MLTTHATPPQERDWLQAECSLFSSTPIEPYIPWTRLLAAVQEWRHNHLIDRFWFVRKPPGLRLRFQEPRGAAGFEATLSRWLVEAERRNDIRGFRFTTYEPESHRFGGDAGMDVAHMLFDAAAALPLQFYAHGSAPLSALEFSVATTSDLLSRCLDDRAEVWDVWCRLGEVIPAAKGVEPGQETKTLDKYLAGLQPLFSVLDNSWASLLDDIERAHDCVARDLRALASAGALKVGLRAWLVAATTFDWNRFGLPNALTELQRGLDRIKRSLAPDGECASR